MRLDTGSDGMNNTQAGLSLIRWELTNGLMDAQVQNTMKTKSQTGQWVLAAFKDAGLWRHGGGGRKRGRD